MSENEALCVVCHVPVPRNEDTCSDDRCVKILGDWLEEAEERVRLPHSGTPEEF